ncbi:MAG: hypothetical protein IKO72_08320 [Kiritimatiellae bacterium]|nr:hypothetical protein [Kiritimatiellia bacterium]
MDNEKFIWSALVHVGSRMWHDLPEDLPDTLQFDENTFWTIAGRLRDIGANMIVLDIGEALVYPSHPELAIKGSLSPEKWQDMLARLRKMGLEPIPKLNFSTCHDIWLGEYSRMVSTPQYYQVCSDVIKDVRQVFGPLRFFHIGYDEEAIGEQRKMLYAAARQNGLWWHDLEWFLARVSETGARPWMWADSFWHHIEEFPKRIPKSVMLSNWYYGRTFTEEGPFERAYEKVRLWAYRALDRLGYDQIPCATNWVPDYYGTPNNLVNFPMTVDYCRKYLTPSLLKGFMMAPWAGSTPKRMAFWNEALGLLEKAIRGA